MLWDRLSDGFGGGDIHIPIGPKHLHLSALHSHVHETRNCDWKIGFKIASNMASEFTLVCLLTMLVGATVRGWLHASRVMRKSGRKAFLNGV